MPPDHRPVLALDPTRLTSSCHHGRATPMCFMRPIPGLWRMCSMALASVTNTSFILRIRSRTSSTRFLLTLTLPMLQRTLVLLALVACVCMLLTFGCRTVFSHFLLRGTGHRFLSSIALPLITSLQFFNQRCFHHIASTIETFWSFRCFFQACFSSFATVV